MSNNTYKHNGFTLIELLVVIAIIALLMAILMPSLAKARKQAQQAVCQVQLKQSSLAFMAYTNDNSGYFWRARQGGYGFTWVDVMRPYFGMKVTNSLNNSQINFDSWCCPSAKIPMSKGGKWPHCAWGILQGTQGGAYVDGAYGSYGFNQWCENNDGEYAYCGTQYYWKTPNVRNAGSVPLFFDSLYVCGWPDTVSSPPAYEGEMPTQASLSEMMKYVVTNRHDGYMDFVFMDSSIRKVGLKELWRLKWNPLSDLNIPLPDWKNEAPWMVKFKNP